MTAPRIEIDLAKIRRNAKVLVGRLARRGIGVTGVTKGVCGHPEIARAMLDGGVGRLADARVSNVERMRGAGIEAPVVLIRTPMPSQADRIVRTCGVSLNTDLGVIHALARSALGAGLVHRVVLMVELGDGREGILPGAVGAVARTVAGMRGVVLSGIGSNFGCLSRRAPDPAAMAALSSLAEAVEADTGLPLETVSGGGSASLPWAEGSRGPSRVDDLRLGEAILLGRDPLSGRPIEGLSTDAFTLVAEVIETVADVPRPVPVDPGRTAARMEADGGGRRRVLLAIGHQDTDFAGLAMPGGLTPLGATGDHLVVGSGSALAVGAEVFFRPNYSAVMRAMSAPDVVKVARGGIAADRRGAEQDRSTRLEAA